MYGIAKTSKLVSDQRNQAKWALLLAFFLKHINLLIDRHISMQVAFAEKPITMAHRSEEHRSKTTGKAGNAIPFEHETTGWA